MLDADAAHRIGTTLSAVFAAGVCALTAHMALRACRSATTSQAVTAAIGAGACVALIQPILIEGTTLGPTTFTLFCATLALASLFSAHGTDRPWRALALAGAAAGLATVNHPSFALLLPVLILCALPSNRILDWWTTAVGVIAVPFTLACSLPYVASYAAGETAEEFWEHSLRTPYPLIGQQPIDWSMPDVLPMPWAWPLMCLACVGVLGITFTGSARFTWPLLIAALMFGPLYPALTHRPLLPSVPIDDAAVHGILSITIIVLATRGAIMLATRLSARRIPAVVATATVMCIACAGMYGQMPQRDVSTSAAVGEYLLEESPQDAIVICGDPYTASILFASQQLLDLREDVTIIPPRILTSARSRDALAAASELNMAPVFPPIEGWNEWAQYRPKEYLSLLDLDGRGGAEGYFATLDDLAQWDLLLYNYRDRPVCFIGEMPDWAVARSRRLDAMAQYPQVGHSPRTRPRVLEAWANSEKIGREPGGAETLAPIFGSISNILRKQARIEHAATFADAARDQLPRDTDHLFSALRAAARTGDARSPSAMMRADSIRRRAAAHLGTWTDALKTDLTTAATERTWLTSTQPGLSEADEIYLAERLAMRAAAWYPQTSYFEFERAAALAQMGRIDDAEASVARWAELVPLPWEVLVVELRADGRFVLLEDLIGPPGKEQDKPDSDTPIAHGGHLGTGVKTGNVLARR